MPLLGVVSRLAEQKGIDLVLPLIDSLVSLPAQLAVLGTGDAMLEKALQAASSHTPRPRRVQTEGSTRPWRT